MSNNDLSQQAIKQLKQKAHALKPIILTGQKGLTDAVINEINIALDAHELIKVKIAGQEKDARLLIAEKISDSTAAHIIQLIGQILTLYREKEES